MYFTIGLFFIAVFLLSWVFLRRKQRNLPPGPYRYPTFWALPFFLGSITRPVHEYMLEASRRYGDIFSFRFGSQQFVVLTGYDLVHQAFVKNASVFSGRPNHLPNQREALQAGKGLVFEGYNDNWKTLRRFTLQALRDFGVGKTSLEEKINDEIVAISEIFLKDKGNPIDITLLLQKAVGNVLYGIIFGKRFDYEDPDFQRIRTFLSRIFEGPSIFHVSNFFPRWLINLVKRKESDRFYVTKDIFVFIKEQIASHEMTFDENNIRDFVDLIIQHLKDEQNVDKDWLTKGNMLKVVMDLFVAGSETTSTALTWGFLYMSEYPEVQMKCQKEIDEVIGDKVLTYSDRDKLLFVEATIREIFRCSNTVPLSLPHITTEDTMLCGYDIPRDTIVYANLASCCMDTKYWTDPAKFDPNRFLDENGKLINNDALLPFSVGPRMCLGESLARMELFLIFSSLIQRFSFSREDENTPHTLKALPTLLTRIPERFCIRAVERT